MKRLWIATFILSVFLFTACKSNLEAYNSAYQKIKEKKESIALEKAQTSLSVKLDNTKNDTVLTYWTDEFVLLLGKETYLSKYNIAAATFVNKTNATSFYKRMKDEGLPAALVQNQDLLYRIVVASSEKVEEAEVLKSKWVKLYPKAIIVIRKRP